MCHRTLPRHPMKSHEEKVKHTGSRVNSGSTYKTRASNPRPLAGSHVGASQPGHQAVLVPSTCSPNYLLMLCLLLRVLSPSSPHHPSGTTSSTQGSGPKSQHQQAQCDRCFFALVWGGPHHLPVRQELPSLFLPASLR